MAQSCVASTAMAPVFGVGNSCLAGGNGVHVSITPPSQRGALLVLPERHAHRARHLSLAAIRQLAVGPHQALEHLSIAMRLPLRTHKTIRLACMQMVSSSYASDDLASKQDSCYGLVLEALMPETCHRPNRKSLKPDQHVNCGRSVQKLQHAMFTGDMRRLEAV